MSGFIYNDFLGTSGTSSVPAMGQEDLEKDVSNELNNSNRIELWGNIVSGVTGIVNGFNYKAQQNQIALAQANADAARANADASANTGKNKAVWIAVAIIVVIVLIVLLKPKSN